MTPENRYWWKIALELKLRKCSGDAFQDFFSSVMHKAHGSDFVRVRPFGMIGDKGCDGYLASVGHVYQCYGALNADSGKVSYLIGKMETDFAKALAGVPAIMKEWHMVHNLVDGLPVDALLKLEKLKTANASHGFGFIGIEGFESKIFALDSNKIEDLLGVAATTKDMQNMQTAELRDLISNVELTSGHGYFDVTSIRPVPPDKLDFNKLPNHWRIMISIGWQNAHHVREYLGRHHDPLLGERIAQTLRVRYLYLREQNLQPGAVMSSLYEFIAGVGSVSVSTQVAAQALLAFLFESCDIFEDEPSKVAS